MIEGDDDLFDIKGNLSDYNNREVKVRILGLK